MKYAKNIPLDSNYHRIISGVPIPELADFERKINFKLNCIEEHGDSYRVGVYDPYCHAEYRLIRKSIKMKASNGQTLHYRSCLDHKNNTLRRKSYENR